MKKTAVPVQGYFNELRVISIYTFVSWLLAFIVIYSYFYDILYYYSIEVIGSTYFTIISRTLTEVVLNRMLYSSIISSIPTTAVFFIYIIYFLIPGLYQSEIQTLLSVVLRIACIILISQYFIRKWILSSIFAYILEGIHQESISVFQIQYGPDSGIFLSTILHTEIIVQLVVFLPILIGHALYHSDHFRKLILRNRPATYQIISVLSILITPPDMFSYILLFCIYIAVLEILLVTTTIRSACEESSETIYI